MTTEPSSDELFVPLVEERAVVSSREVVTGTVRVTTRVETHQAQIREALRRENVVVERVPIGREVDVVPAIRQEGETFVYPIVEERVVVEKRLFLKEEVHVSYKITTEEFTETVNLRSVHADVERTPANNAQATPPQSDKG